MRRVILSLAALAASGLAQAPPPGFPAIQAQADLPQGQGPQVVTQLLRTIPVGGASGWHSHPGLEITYVLGGITEMRRADGTSLRYATGESFVIPRGVVHNGVNVGKVPLLLVVTYITDKGAPLRIDAPAPSR